MPSFRQLMQEMTAQDLLQDDRLGVHEFFKALQDIKLSNWVSRATSQRLVQAARKVPHIVGEVQEELRAEHGPSIGLLRGLSFFGELTPEVHKLLSAPVNSQMTLKSWKRRTVFEWTNNDFIAKHFAGPCQGKGEYRGGVVLTASVPVAQILWYTEALDRDVEQVAEKDVGIAGQSFRHEQGFFVWHNKPIEARVVFNRGPDKDKPYYA